MVVVIKAGEAGFCYHLSYSRVQSQEQMQARPCPEPLVLLTAVTADLPIASTRTWWLRAFLDHGARFAHPHGKPGELGD